MSAVIAALAILCGLILASVGLSLWVLLRVKVWLRAAAQKAAAYQERSDTALDELRRRLDGLAAMMEEVRQQAAPVSQIAPRGGLNLSKRSQALRMHRRGDGAEQIASTLEIPRQEVDLLLKVHRIVISSIM
jgi:hypothetical protein